MGILHEGVAGVPGKTCPPVLSGAVTGRMRGYSRCRTHLFELKSDAGPCLGIHPVMGLSEVTQQHNAVTAGVVTSTVRYTCAAHFQHKGCCVDRNPLRAPRC